MEESDDDEKEDNEAEEVDRCTPFACARRRGSCFRNGMGCNQREKGLKVVSKYEYMRIGG